jgi:biopolymer transport protein ExbD
LTVTQDGPRLLDETPVTVDTLAAPPKPLLPGHEGKIVAAADQAAPSRAVVAAMLQAREGGAEHFLMAIKRQ